MWAYKRINVLPGPAAPARSEEMIKWSIMNIKAQKEMLEMWKYIFYSKPHYVSCHISCSQAASAIDYLSTINTESTEASAHFEVIY